MKYVSQALEELSNFETRKKICDQMKESLRKRNLSPFFAPNPHFYVRAVKSAKTLAQTREKERLRVEKEKREYEKVFFLLKKALYLLPLLSLFLSLLL
jgi:hypothetical protein